MGSHGGTPRAVHGRPANLAACSIFLGQGAVTPFGFGFIFLILARFQGFTSRKQVGNSGQPVDNLGRLCQVSALSPLFYWAIKFCAKNRKKPLAGVCWFA